VEFVKDTSLLTTREQVHLDWNPCLSEDLRYTFCPTASSWLGATHTAETKALIRESIVGNTNALGNTNRLGTTHTPPPLWGGNSLNQPSRKSVFVYELLRDSVGPVPVRTGDQPWGDSPQP